MDAETVRIIGMVCAGIAVVSTVFCQVLRYKELRVLREIRDGLGKPHA
jgi:hypothetical protein